MVTTFAAPCTRTSSLRSIANRWLPFLAVALLACAGCSSNEGNSSASSTGANALPPIGGDRPIEVTEPDNLEPGAKAPLILLLHGYGVSGLVEEIYMGLRPLAHQKGFFYAFPPGTLDADGVALAGVRALGARSRELRSQHDALLARVAELERALADALEAVRALKGGR